MTAAVLRPQLRLSLRSPSSVCARVGCCPPGAFALFGRGCSPAVAIAVAVVVLWPRSPVACPDVVARLCAAVVFC